MRPRHVHAARQCLQDLVEQRLHLLEDRDKYVVQCAALLGYRVDANLLAACVGWSLAATLAVLRRAEKLDLVVSEQGARVRYRFRHALTQAAIRSALPTRTERALHAAIARALEGLPDAGARVEQLAHHWFSAGVRLGADNSAGGEKQGAC
jgi:predicted ATPase